MIETCKTYTYKSSSGLCDISAWGYFPAENIKIKGIVQIAHGMAEHHGRYEDFISYLNDNGYAVFINDHLGHGKSVADDSQLGFFGAENGWMNIVNDAKSLTDIAKSELPDLPVILFGHSMGSFVARLYSSICGDAINGAVYCGTAGANPVAGVGIAVVKSIIKLKGTHHRSKLIDNLAFGTYNSKIKPARTSFDWLTSDNDIVDKYIDDKYCGFLFTACGYRDLMEMIIEINRPEWFSAVRNDLPIYLIAGDADPVGNYGKGIKEVYRNLADTRHSDVAIKLFEGDRHEILNEKDKCDVYRSVLSWLNAIIE
ncbi:MAG: lysophospholipase [Clostridia bacterium]|nr:lysophospholipase [Clostridia bacterium]